MKLPARAMKCLELLDEIGFTVDYYSGGNDLHVKDIKYLKEYIAEISESKKLTNIKLAVKIKKELDDSDS
jgi:hypothetical protein|tara:strand:- start:202 stop:411 length:210 start_codon:yes stop_codon:yes gene_type:complete